jgi:hypothetical protein
LRRRTLLVVEGVEVLMPKRQLQRAQNNEDRKRYK